MRDSSVKEFEKHIKIKQSEAPENFCSQIIPDSPVEQKKSANQQTLQKFLKKKSKPAAKSQKKPQAPKYSAEDLKTIEKLKRYQNSTGKFKDLNPDQLLLILQYQ